MEADFSIDLGPDAPALELPWHDPEGRWHYVPLRTPRNGHRREDDAARRDRIPRIPEAQRFSALRRFLEAANSAEDFWQSVKCGVWAEEAAAEQNFFAEAFEHGSYVDLVLCDACAGLRDNLSAHENWARQLAAMLEEQDACERAFAEVVVRRCYFHRAAESEESPEESGESDAGYCLSLFVFGYGPDANAALVSWERALGAAAACLPRLQPRAGQR